MVEIISPFKGLKNKIVEIKIGEDTIKLKPRVADAELFLTMKETMDDKSVKIPTTVLCNMIKRANPEEDEEDIKAYIAMNYGDLVVSIAPLFGFKSDVVKSIGEQIKKKKD